MRVSVSDGAWPVMVPIFHVATLSRYAVTVCWYSVIGRASVLGMAKTQFNVRMSESAADAARMAAADQRISLNEYIERLVTADTNPQRAASLEYTGTFIQEWGDFIENEAARVQRG
jgi:hypothetical protein